MQENMSFVESEQINENKKTLKSPIIVRKVSSSVANNPKIHEILQTKKNNRNLNYNMIKENKNLLNKTIDGTTRDATFRVGPIRVDESQSIQSSRMSNNPYLAKQVKLPMLISTPQSTKVSGIRGGVRKKTSGSVCVVDGDNYDKNFLNITTDNIELL